MALQWAVVVTNNQTLGTFLNNYSMYPADQYYYNNANVIWGILTQYGWTLNAICGALGVMAWESAGLNPGVGEFGGWPLPTGTTGNWNEFSHPSGLALAQFTAPNGFYPVYNTKDPNPLLALSNKYNKDWFDGSFQLLAIDHCNDPNYTVFYCPSLGRDDQIWGWRQGGSADYHIVNSWDDYRHSTLSPEELAKAYLACVEGVPGGFGSFDYNWRQQEARFWYNTFYGKTPDPDVPVYPSGGDTPIPPYPPGPYPPNPPKRTKLPLWMYNKNRYYIK